MYDEGLKKKKRFCIESGIVIVYVSEVTGVPSTQLIRREELCEKGET